LIPLGNDKEKERVRERKGGKEERKEGGKKKRELYVITRENVLCGMWIVNLVLEVLSSTILDRRGSESNCRGNISKIRLQQNHITHRNKGLGKLLAYVKF